MNTKVKTDKKLQQFLDEINDIQEVYQYTLVPVLSVTKQGIVPGFSVENRVPPKKDRNPKKVVKPKKKK